MKDPSTRQSRSIQQAARLCFAGRPHSQEIELHKLISVDAYTDALAIRRSGKEKVEFFFGLDRHTYSSVVEGRSYAEPMSGLILKYAIEGLLATAVLILRCTAKLLGRVGPPQEPTVPSTTILGDWYAAPLGIARRRYVLLIRALPPAGAHGGPRPAAPAQ